MVEDVEHYKGCNCKKSGCLKKYCECFQANILCSDKCKCMDCKNFEGREERKALFHGIPANSVVVIQQLTNAAINEAIGTPPSKKRKNQRMLFRITPNDQLTSRLRQFSQETGLASDASYSLLSSIHLSKPDSATTLGPTFYRSSLAGMIQSHHVKDLCALLIKDSAEAARTFTEEKTMITNDAGVNEAKTSVVSSHVDHKDNGNSGKNQEVGVRTSLGESAGSAIENRRPFSPTTLALMCDEQDTSFMTDDFPHNISNSNTRTPMESSSTEGLSPLYPEQEKLVLTKLNCFFKELISRLHLFEETKVEHKVDNDLCTDTSSDGRQSETFSITNLKDCYCNRYLGVEFVNV